jgi:hypothetical protein
MLVTHLIGSPIRSMQPSEAAMLITPGSVRPPPVPGPIVPPLTITAPRSIAPETSNPREVVVGPAGINNRYTLTGVSRKKISPNLDELSVELHVVSLASENMVSPFESDMFELKSPGLNPILSRAEFRRPVPSGHSEDQEIVFEIPSSLSLKDAILRIHYYNYQGEIPLLFDKPRTF